MIWPQVSLAQLAAMIHRRYSVGIVDAIATRMSWQQYEKLLREKRPRLYPNPGDRPTLTNDMYGVFLAKSLGARTIAFGTHVTPMPRETMEPFPCLDFIIRGKPEHTFQELVDTLITKADRGDGLGGVTSWEDVEPTQELIAHRLSSIEGLVWRRDGEIVVNPDRLHPESGRPTPAAAPAVAPGQVPGSAVRRPLQLRGHEPRLPRRLQILYQACELSGLRADALPREHTAGAMGAEPTGRAQRPHVRRSVHSRPRSGGWAVPAADRGGAKAPLDRNSRVDMVDPEMLRLMGQAGCWWVSWGIESGNREILRRARKGIDPEKVERALRWAREAGIKNWGYFIIGLPGETESTIRETISFAKSLPLDLALFHIAAPHPGTPFFFEVMENGWFRPGTCWEEVDMDRSTVLDYPNLKAEELERWQRRAFREWALRPGPAKTYLEMLARPGAVRSALEAATGLNEDSLGVCSGDGSVGLN